MMIFKKNKHKEKNIEYNLLESCKLGIVSYVVIQLRDDNFENIELLIEGIVDLLDDSGAVIDHLQSCFITAIFGFPFSNNYSNNVEVVIQKLIEKYSSDIKIVYGKEEAVVKNWGSKKRFYYGPFIKNFDSKINILLELGFGEKKEIV